MNDARSFVRACTSAALALVFAVELLGVPRLTNEPTGFETTARRLDLLLARGDFAEALQMAGQMRAQWPGAIADRQLARALAGLGRNDEEAEAWLEFLRHSPVVADACLRLSELGKDRMSERCIGDTFEPGKTAAQ